MLRIRSRMSYVLRLDLSTFHNSGHPSERPCFLRREAKIGAVFSSLFSILPSLTYQEWFFTISYWGLFSTAVAYVFSMRTWYVTNYPFQRLPTPIFDFVLGLRVRFLTGAPPNGA